jgi:hypothetical protein
MTENLPAPLNDLSTRINEEHRQCERAVQATVQHAITAGELLIQAKAQCPHGTWGKWLSENFEGSHRTAQAYMRVAREWPELSKSADSAHLSIDAALKALAEPRKQPPADSMTKNEAEAIKSDIDVKLASLVENVHAIRSTGAYKLAGYSTFDEFCRAEWLGLSEKEVDDLVTPGGDRPAALMRLMELVEAHENAPADNPRERYTAMILAEIQSLVPGIELTPTALIIPENADVSYETWKRVGALISSLPTKQGGAP